MINNIVIDKLTLCYSIKNPEILAEIILGKETDQPKEIEFDNDFKLYITKKKGFKSAYSITYYDIVSDDMGEYKPQQYLFGVLKFGQIDGNEDDVEILNKKVWIDINNSTFYFRYNQESSKLVYLNYITERLGLQLNNLTHIDIAADSSVINFAKTIKSLLRCEELVPIVVNKAYENRDKLIPHIQFIYSTSCNKLLNDFSLYIQQRGNENIVLNCYNKMNEIIDSSEKDYIAEYYNYPPRLHRLEIRLHRKQFHQFIEDNAIEFEDSLFHDTNFLTQIFEFHITKLIRFRKGKSGKDSMNIFDSLIWLEAKNRKIRTDKRRVKLNK
jgi:hypothetical protein